MEMKTEPSIHPSKSTHLTEAECGGCRIMSTESTTINDESISLCFSMIEWVPDSPRMPWRQHCCNSQAPEQCLGYLMASHRREDNSSQCGIDCWYCCKHPWGSHSCAFLPAEPRNQCHHILQRTQLPLTDPPPISHADTCKPFLHAFMN